jgi:hypothetical protein
VKIGMQDREGTASAATHFRTNQNRNGGLLSPESARMLNIEDLNKVPRFKED